MKLREMRIILRGESIAAVMPGMASQEHCSPSAASAALLGIGLVFAIWWWYFDGADAAAVRRLRSRHDVVRFHFGTFPHLPLYLGIAVAGDGVEHIITTVTEEPLHGVELASLCSAVALVMLSLTLIGSAAPKSRTHRRSLLPHGIVGALTVLLVQVTL